ncbi:uracil-DNA glycosylase [Scheffersomyces coipomensis]|uniref:uracil-DNA glycosylase n=1 Tax=Scheffersomyces coipomensis TaxID=1788519 RepID=UPI00315D464A
MVVKRKSKEEVVRSVSITDYFKSNGDGIKKTKLKGEVTIKEVEIEDAKHGKNENETDNTNTEQSENEEQQEEDYSSICQLYNFNKEKWIASLTLEQQDLLQLEIRYLHISWLAALHKELTKPYFINLKKFLQSQFKDKSKTIFPPTNQIYSWSSLTPLNKIKCIILGQDPYHNHNQAHGLAFSVLDTTPPPPSLINIYKTLKVDYPQFEIPNLSRSKPGGGNLNKWADRGVLMLNAVLTVECHKANSHAKKGWEIFTEEIIKVAIDFYESKQVDSTIITSNNGSKGFVIMAWGNPAQKRIANFKPRLQLEINCDKFLILETVHPSPLSASRGFFTSKVFKQCNDWLHSTKQNKIDWGLLDGNVVL